MKKEKIRNILDDIVRDLTNQAEIRTERICQVCGKNLYSKNDTVVSKGWIGYYCKQCAKDNNIQ